MPITDIIPLLSAALDRRTSLSDTKSNDSMRLFNGFYEGRADFSIDLYANTLVILWTAKKTRPALSYCSEITDFYRARLPFLNCALLKDRFGNSEEGKKGQVIFGSQPASLIHEWGIPYTIDLCLNKDCGFYLDSALLRKWLKENSKGKRVLNTFAYTGSLGIAADAGGAASVIQTDINGNYLQLSTPKSSQSKKIKSITGDFFHITSGLRRSGRLFDTIILDPPFFSTTNAGKVDQLQNGIGLINKLRPLAAHGGKIIAINNALFMPGSEWMAQLESLCGEYLQIDSIIPVPECFFGGNHEDVKLPSDPAPFNHSTKIVVLNTSRKDQRV